MTSMESVQTLQHRPVYVAPCSIRRKLPPLFVAARAAMEVASINDAKSATKTRVCFLLPEINFTFYLLNSLVMVSPCASSFVSTMSLCCSARLLCGR
jgi:hypothetical protein